MIELVDTHIHLYDEAYEKDFSELLQRASTLGIKKFYLPGINSQTHKKSLALQEKNPEVFRAMIGLHPVYVKKDTLEAELRLVENYLQQNSFVAVGEIGIDLHWNKDKENLKLQRQAFLFQIKLAKKYNIPIVIHSREAFNEVLEILEDQKDQNLRGVFHCFSGDLSQAQRIIELGFSLGIGGIVTFKNAKLDSFLSQISLEHILLETDGPYLAPSPFRGKRNEPEFLDLIAQKIASIYGVSKWEVASMTTKNAKALFEPETK